MITAFKCAVVGAASLVGVSGMTLAEKIIGEANATQGCMTYSVGSDDITSYHNRCSQPVNVMVCEEYGNFRLPLFLPGRGMKSCFYRSFSAAETYPYQGADIHGRTKLSIMECGGSQRPQWSGVEYSCL